MPSETPEELGVMQLDEVTLLPVRSPQGPWGQHFFGAFDR
ncbi:MAG: hypothetical protein RLZZ235_510, partial [Pseudomonadota bacterium]